MEKRCKNKKSKEEKDNKGKFQSARTKFILILIQIHWTKLNSTKQNEKYEIWFDRTKSDSAIRHLIRRNKSSIFGVNSAPNKRLVWDKHQFHKQSCVIVIVFDEANNIFFRHCKVARQQSGLWAPLNRIYYERVWKRKIYQVNEKHCFYLKFYKN